MHSIESHSIPSYLWRPTSSAARVSACGDCVTVAPSLHASRHAMCVCLPIAGAQLHAQVQRACDDETCRDAITSAVVAFLGTRNRRSILTSCHVLIVHPSLYVAYCTLHTACCRGTAATRRILHPVKFCFARCMLYYHVELLSPKTKRSSAPCDAQCRSPGATSWRCTDWSHPAALVCEYTYLPLARRPCRLGRSSIQFGAGDWRGVRTRACV